MVNATAFIGGNYLARALGRGDKAALEEKVHHDKALEAFETLYSYDCKLFFLIDLSGYNKIDFDL